MNKTVERFHVLYEVRPTVSHDTAFTGASRRHIPSLAVPPCTLLGRSVFRLPLSDWHLSLFLLYLSPYLLLHLSGMLPHCRAIRSRNSVFTLQKYGDG